MTAASFSGTLDIDSGATIDISGDNFTNIGNQGVVATGDPNATINLADNYWGTTVLTQIEAKILDHSTDPTTRPTINFQPYVSNTSGTVANPVAATSSPNDQTVTLSATVTDSAGIVVNQGTETFTILDGTQVIGQTTTPEQVVNGAVSAMYTLPGGTLPGQYVIEASYSGSGSDYLPSTDTSHFLTVNPAPATKVAFSQQPSNAVAGSLISPSIVVDVEDAFGNVVTGDSSVVTLTLSSQSFAGGSTTATAVASGGVATFSGLKIDVAGSYTLSATDGALTGSGPSSAFTISPAPATYLVVTTSFASQDVAGTKGTVTVAAYDTYNNPVSSGPNQYLGTVDLSRTDTRMAGLPASYTFVASDQGSHTFTNVAFETVGSQTITATDSANATITGISSAVTVTTASASQLVIIIPPYSTVTAGNPLTDPIVIDEEDAYGNLETTDNSTTVTASLATGAGTLSGTTHETLSGGVASFGNLEDNTAGTLSLQFAAGSLPPVISTPSVVTPAAASTLIIKRPPTGVITGTTFAIEVDAQDPYGNLATSFNAPVTVTNVSGRLGGTTTVPASGGVANFMGLVANSSGSISLSAQSGGLTSGASGGVTITVTRPIPPTIIGTLVVDYTQTLKKGKPVGKKTLAGYTIDYSTTMNQGSIGNSGNYKVDIFVTKKQGKKKVKVPKPIGFSVTSVTSDSVTLKLTGKQTFPIGGQITVIGSPGGVENTADVPLATNEVFTISNGGKSSSAPSP